MYECMYVCMCDCQLSGSVDLLSPDAAVEKLSSQDYLGSIEYHVSADAALEDYCRGCRVLQV